MAKTKSKSKSTEPQSVGSILSNIGSKKESASKSKTPIIRVTDAETRDAVISIIEAQRAEKAAKSRLAASTDAFRDQASDAWREQCVSDNRLHSSVKFVVQDEEAQPSLTFTQKAQMTKMDEGECRASLMRIFGDMFDRFFSPKYEVSIDVSKLSNSQVVAIVESLQKILSSDFTDVVASKCFLVPNDAYFDARVLDPKVRRMSDQAESEGLAKLYSPSFTS